MAHSGGHDGRTKRRASLTPYQIIRSIRQLDVSEIRYAYTVHEWFKPLAYSIKVVFPSRWTGCQSLRRWVRIGYVGE